MIPVGTQEERVARVTKVLDTFGARLALAGALMLGEVTLMTTLVETGDLHGATGLARLAMKGSGALRILVMATFLTAILLFLESKQYKQNLLGPKAGKTFFPLAALANLLSLLSFAYLSLRLFNRQTAAGSHDVLTVLCVLSGLAMLITAGLTFVSVEKWGKLFRISPIAPVLGLSTALAVSIVTSAAKPFWMPWMRLTYKVVLAGLQLVCSNVVADAGQFVLGTTRFSVVIDSGCSGYEGVALMFVFGSMWLWFFRREFRFPHALLLLPVGMATIWLFNCVRILFLILIGNAGAPAIAAGGFHSEAGWISFILLSAGLMLAGPRIAWISSAPQSRPHSSEINPTAAYLLPFLSILAMGMLSHAATASFEWFYPLRVITAVILIWWFRRIYTELNWQIGWESVAIGVLIFVVWIGTEFFTGMAGRTKGMPSELTASSGWIRIGWLAFRVIGAILTVPIAEELAFRGYGLRRLVNRNFTAVDFRKASYTAITVSSLLFGLMHGSRWQAGVIAGVLYALAARRRGSIGNAVMAHAVTNALLAFWVIYTGAWYEW